MLRLIELAADHAATILAIQNEPVGTSYCVKSLQGCWVTRTLRA